MDHGQTHSASPEQRPRKRRAINACANCRASKVRCDGKQPCQRCERNSTLCMFYETVKDPHTLRIEKLEQEVGVLRNQLSQTMHQSSQQIHQLPDVAVIHPVVCHRMRGPNTNSNAVEAGLVTQPQAILWYKSFFSGIQYLVPFFCQRKDTFDSVSARSHFLFDAVISIGCRAEEGFDSIAYHQLQSRLRDHLTNLIIHSEQPKVEDVQAIALVAAYSENGFVLIALALRFALQLNLHHSVDCLIVGGREVTGTSRADDQELYRLSRIWHGVCNLELFFSLDGGKLPGMTLQTSSRKIRCLVTHPERTAVDVRLLSQIELNMIRTEAYHKIAQYTSDASLPHSEGDIRAIVEYASVELSLWLQEWTNLVAGEPDPRLSATARQNLRIQYEWAMMTLNLKAVAATGIENIAFMTDLQRDFVFRAKEAASRHLHHMLGGESSPVSPQSPQSNPAPTYLSTFRWTLDYVWAKCAVSVLLVLKLAILLRDPVPAVMALLRDAHRVLEELKNVTVGHIAYFQILQASVEKCEAALQEYTARQSASPDAPTAHGDENGSAEDEFQGYVPNEFVFEWDFPGLNLKHMPLGWQDLFVNIDSLF
ncbi:hypothetical protein T440DRAFT_497599 [Plenodomus tracheiphilus IPT5]|uniref:Zn(2)-C6 fungal-type domain-containing protein n=1 Tax=Plenodomus tracheiphilus IPT5 TaxID=1408161 RepID=A0A6A7BCX0_9PLEO|nr:hypothetical protein T440DRAFT_497599 [Plenodomus tracheiphilus IPT5]